MRFVSLKVIVLLAAAALASGCAKGPLYAPVQSASAGGASAASAPAPRSFSGINIDQGQSPSGGLAYGSWHAGVKRDQQVLCPTPPDFLGAEAWKRFEACVAYLNGALSRAEYNAVIRSALAAQGL